MIQVIVLGFDCEACRKAYKLFEQVAQEKDNTIELNKVSDPQLFIQYQVLSAPGIIINQQLIHQGGCPDRQSIIKWLNAFS